MNNKSFSGYEILNAIIANGLNTGTHKIVLFQTLAQFYESGHSTIKWEDLSKTYLDIYIKRLKKNRMPQQSIPHRQSIQENVFDLLENEKISKDEAINRIGKKGFNDVIPRFHSFGKDSTTFENFFYNFYPGKKLILKDNLFKISKLNINELVLQATSKLGTLEGNYLLKHKTYKKFKLYNDKKIYL